METMSTRTAFKCGEEDRLAVCLKVTGFVDSAAGAKFAKMASSKARAEAAELDTKCALVTSQILEHLEHVNKMSGDLDKMSDRINSTTMASVLKGMSKLLRTSVRGTLRSTQCTEESTSAFKADVIVTRYYLEALRKFESAEKADKLASDMKRPEECKTCGEVVSGAKEMRRGARRAAALAGTWAKAAVRHSFKTSDLLKRLEVTRMAADKAHSRVSQIRHQLESQASSST